MFVVVTTAVVTAIVLAVVLRFFGAFLRNPELTDSAFAFGALAALLTFIGGMVLLKALGNPSWLFMFLPLIVALVCAAFGGVVIGCFFLFSWLTTSVDALANRGRELTEEYNFHRHLDRDE